MPTDAELAALALAADPDVAVPVDAVPLPRPSGADDDLLPGWYMPPAAAGPRHHRPWVRRVVYVLIAAFLAIEAAGLCSTYGPVVIG